MTILFFILIAVAISIFYLSLNHQRWRPQALPKKLSGIAIILLITALFCGLYVFSLGTTIFVIIVIAMLLLSLLPFLSLLKPSYLKRGEHDDH